jgi:hypothetical protein
MALFKEMLRYGTAFLLRNHSHAREPLQRFQPLATIAAERVSIAKLHQPFSISPRPLSFIQPASSLVLFTMPSSDYSTGTGTNPGGDNDGGLISLAIPFMWNAMTVVVGLAAVLAGLLYVKQDSLLYYPGTANAPLLACHCSQCHKQLTNTTIEFCGFRNWWHSSTTQPKPSTLSQPRRTPGAF